MTKIEWTHRAGTTGVTWNPIRAKDIETGKDGWFCAHASDGCRNCYAENINAKRFGNGHAYKAQNAEKVACYVHEKTLTEPLRWRKPRTVFVCSMTDLFGEFHTDAMIDRVFAVMALCPQHTFMVLTKRADRMRKYLGGDRLSEGHVTERLGYLIHEMGETRNLKGSWAVVASALIHGPNHGAFPHLDVWPRPNVWLGCSVEDQKTADQRVPDLLNTPAAVRFVSYEPALGPVDFMLWLTLDQIIFGGESGPNKRPVDLEWARIVRDQCRSAGVAFFMKQVDKKQPIPDDLMIREWPR